MAFPQPADLNKQPHICKYCCSSNYFIPFAIFHNFTVYTFFGWLTHSAGTDQTSSVFCTYMYISPLYVHNCHPKCCMLQLQLHLGKSAFVHHVATTSKRWHFMFFRFFAKLSSKPLTSPCTHTDTMSK